MVGNDVVDLLDPDTDPGRPRDRFDARVCRAEERRAIAAACVPSLERWCHWAAKEAAYKVKRKRDTDVVFSPVRFEVTLDPAPDGWAVASSSPDDSLHAARRRAGFVRHGADEFALSIELSDGALHAIATMSEGSAREPRGVGARVTSRPSDGPAASDDGLLVGRLRLAADDRDAEDPAGHSRAVRRLALDRIATRLGVAPARLSITKRDRIPELRVDGARFGADLSLSHHGRVVAFACRLPVSAGVERLAS